MGLRLPLAGVTVLLGASAARRAVMGALDESTGRCATGHAGVQSLRVTVAPEETVAGRLAAVDDAARSQATIVLVDRITDGLTAADRRAVLARVRASAARGRAILVDDGDPVAALAVADWTLRADAEVESDHLTAEPVVGADELAEAYDRAS